MARRYKVALKTSNLYTTLFREVSLPGKYLLTFLYPTVVWWLRVGSKALSNYYALYNSDVICCNLKCLN